MSKRKLFANFQDFGAVKRNIILTDEELENKNKAAKNKYTEKQNKRADRAFHNFLLEAGCMSTDYWLYEEAELDTYLAKFWHGVRKSGVQDIEKDKDDDGLKKNLKYTANSMKSFRYALNRVLKSKGHFYDITDKKALSFRKSNDAFKTVLKELKSEGLAEVKSAPEITVEDQIKMYNHPYLDPNGDRYSLQRKVQFDIHFFFCRRGAENMDTMQKNDFKFQYNKDSDIWFVMKTKDELTKNHRGCEEIISGYMPENRDDPLCPVKSFQKYLQHLEPRNPYLWQTPFKDEPKKNPNIWYTMGHLGKNTLSPFMKEVSDKCKLSQMYTNHSIRVTGCTVLTRMQFSSSEIMSVSGHKSVQSLAIYQKTQPKQKLQMGSAMFQSMTRKEEDVIIPNRRKLLPRQEFQALPPAVTTEINNLNPTDKHFFQ